VLRGAAGNDILLVAPQPRGSNKKKAAPASSAKKSSAKKKAPPPRESEDDEMEEEEEEEEEENEDENEDDEDASPPKKGAKAGGAKKQNAKLKAGDTNLPKKAAAKKKAKAPEPPAVASGSIYECIAHNGAIQVHVDKWMDDFGNEPDAAVKEIIEFLFHAAGCEGVTVGQTHFSAEDEAGLQASRIQTLIDESKLEAKYPLIDKAGSFSTRFKKNFVEFWSRFIDSSSSGAIYEEEFHQQILQWVAAFTQSDHRALRHTGTLAASSILKGYASCLNKLQQNHDLTERQIAAEGNKSSKSASKLKQLDDNLNILTLNEERLEQAMDWFFKTTLKIRYKDSFVDIRVATVDCIGDCVVACPGFFLEPIDKFIKYLGWQLSDRDAHVRASVLDALIKFFQAGMVEKVFPFTKRFVKRLHGMSKDSNPDVASKAIEVLGFILNNKFCMDAFEGAGEDDEQSEQMRQLALSEDEIEEIYALVLADNKDMAKAAGKLVVQTVLEADETPAWLYDDDDASPKTPGSSKKGKSPKGKSPKKATENRELRRLLDFALCLQRKTGNALPKVCTTVVRSFWELTGASKDVSGMMVMLLDDATLSEEQQEGVALMMASSLKKFHDARASATGKTGKKATKDKIEEVSDKHDDTTKSAMKTLPQLLLKFKAETPVLDALLGMPQNMNLSIFADSRSRKGLMELVDVACEIMQQTASQPLIAAVGHVLTVVNECGGEISTHLETKLHDVLAKVNKSVHAGVDKGNKQKTPTKKPSSTADTLVLGLCRCSCLAQAIQADLAESESLTSKIVSCYRRKAGGMSPEVVVAGLKHYFQVICMHLKDNVSESEELVANATPPQQLMEHVAIFMDHCHQLLGAEDAEPRQVAYTTMADVLCLTSASSMVTSSEPDVFYQCDARLEQKLLEYFESEVDRITEDFSGADADEAEKAKRMTHHAKTMCQMLAFGSFHNPVQLGSKVLALATDSDGQHTKRNLRNTFENFLHHMMADKKTRPTVATLILGALRDRYERDLVDETEGVGELAKFVSSRMLYRTKTRDGEESKKNTVAHAVAFALVKNGVDELFKKTDDDEVEAWLPFLEQALLPFISSMTSKLANELAQHIIDCSPSSRQLRMDSISSYHALLKAAEAGPKGKKATGKRKAAGHEEEEEEEEDDDAPMQMEEDEEDAGENDTAEEEEDAEAEEEEERPAAKKTKGDDADSGEEEEEEEEEEEDTEMSQAPPPKAIRHRTRR